MRGARRAALVLLWLPLLAQAAVYKWTDSQGVLHYDDRNLASGKAMTQDEVKNRQIKPVPDWTGVVPAEFARDIEQRCAQSRERLAGYRSAKTLFGRDPDGHSYPLSATQSRLLIAQSARETAELCDADAPRRLYLQPKQKQSANN